jgi:hypothetical protein
MNDLRMPISPFFRRWVVLTFGSGSGYARLSTIVSVKVKKPKVSSIPYAANALVTLGFWITLSRKRIDAALEACLVTVDDGIDIILKQ